MARAGRLLLTAVALLVLAMLVWLPRGLELDRAVTTDESIWLARSGNFYQALANGDLAATFQYAHPGVTTMWAGVIAIRLGYPAYADVAPDSIRPWNNAILPVLDEAGIDPLDMLVAARQVIVLFTTLGIVALGWYAVRLLGLGAGLLGGALIALDPFHVALSQLLHVDALVSVLATLSASAWLTYLLRERRRHDLVVAGVALGLAGLTRSTAVVVVPMMAVSLLLEHRSDGDRHRDARASLNRLRPLLTVGAIALATVVIAWPALWTNPVGTIGKVVAGTRNLAEEAHARAIFFEGRIYDGVDPGIRFYPTALLWRTTPAMLVGVVIAAAIGLGALTAVRRRAGRPSPEARAAGYLALLALLAVLMLSVSDKKFDRYVVLAVPPLVLVVGWAYGVAGRAVARRLDGVRPRLAALAVTAGALLVLGVTAAETVAVHPYPLSSYNALLGGTEGAQDTLMIGAGEGFDQVAATLDALPDLTETRIVTSAWEAPISYFTDVADIRLVDLTTASGVGTWLMADYYVWDVTSDQRGAVPRAIQDHIAGLTPLSTVRLNGVTYAAVYDLRGGGIPAALVAASRPVSGAGLRLITTAVPTGTMAPGTELPVTMFLTGDSVGEGRIPLRLTLLDANGLERSSGGYGFLRTGDGGVVFSIRRDLPVPSYLPTGTYQVIARFGGEDDATTLVLGTVGIVEPPQPPPS